jgi:O-antigen ligase
MRRLTWLLLLLFTFAIPWEYSLELGPPLGNIARFIGLVLLVVAVPAILRAGGARMPGPLQWLVLVLFLWFCCSFLGTIEPQATLAKIRGYIQEMMTVWLIWEFAETPGDLRDLLRSYVAGSWVLAGLTMASLMSPEAAGQIRFVADGQDPNDVARFLDLGFPMAALLLDGESHWAGKLLAWGYMPMGLAGVLLTASRGGFLVALVALVGCGLLLARSHVRRLLAVVFASPVLIAMLWFTVPRETLERIGTISEQFQGGDLNQRLNIWQAGWQAFAHAPFFGTGAGTYVGAARLAPIDTAHNTVLAILVEGGIFALILAAAIVVVCVHSVSKTGGPVRIAFATALLVWLLTSLVATVTESRSTWLLLGMIVLAGRLATEEAESLIECFTRDVSFDAGLVRGTT